MSFKVNRREVLHFQDAKADKVYVVEEVTDGSATHIFTLWGRRGAKTLQAKDHGSYANFFRLVDDRKGKGYQPKGSTVGLTSEESDFSLTLVPTATLDAAFPTTPLPGAAAMVPPTSEVEGNPAPEADASAPLAVEALASVLAEILDDTALRLKSTSLKVTRDTSGAIQVDSENTPGLRYHVALNPPTCDCPWFTGRGTPCKHLSAAAHAFADKVMDEERKKAAIAAVTAVVEAAGIKMAPPKPLDPIDAIFLPLVLPDAGHPLVPKLEAYLWDEPTAKLFAAAMKRGKHVLMFGDAGTGKSSLVENFAARTQRPVLRINMSGQTSPADLIGHYIVADGKTIWLDGALPMAMREGLLLLVDELDMALPEVLALLHPVLEPGGRLVLKEHDGEIVEPHENFRLFSTANSLGLHDETGIYTGTNAMNAAFLSRWTCIEKGNPDKDTEAAILVMKGLPKKIAATVAVAGELIRKLIHVERRITGAWGVRHSMDFGEYALDLGSYEIGFDAASKGKFSSDERKALWEALQRLCGGPVM